MNKMIHLKNNLKNPKKKNNKLSENFKNSNKISKKKKVKN